MYDLSLYTLFECPKCHRWQKVDEDTEVVHIDEDDLHRAASLLDAGYDLDDMVYCPYCGIYCALDDTDHFEETVSFDGLRTEFAEYILPDVIAQHEQDGHRDVTARCAAWNNWTDGLCKDGRISDRQYTDWPQPEEY